MRWTDESSALAGKLLAKCNVKDPCYGTIPLGEDRLTTPSRRCRKNLARFLLDEAQTETLYDTIWTHPNRKLLSVYPEVILPTYESAGFRNVLIAIDTSGSVPDAFISVAMNFARQKVPRTKITLISFDVNAYEALPAATLLKGGGGTRAQAVEEYVFQKLQRYPDCVFVLTDGYTSPLQISKPERWTWLLPPWGSDGSLPKDCRIEYFEAADL
jgi:predicted metal-dependent peptidase